MTIKSLQTILRKEKIDLLILSHPDPALTYITTIHPSQAILAVTPLTATLYLSVLDKKPSLPRIKIKEYSSHWDKDLLASEKSLTSKKAHSIGLNKDACSARFLEKIHSLFPKAKIVDLSPHLKSLRSLKNSAEVKKITKACKVTTAAFAALCTAFQKKPRQFQTEMDVALFLELFIRSQGCELAFPTIVASGKNSSIPHHITSTEKLCPGFLQLDFGAKYDHYCADMSRVLYLGIPSPEERGYYTLLHLAQQTALQNIKKDLSFESLTSITRKSLGKYSSYFIHSLGHGVGVEIHEAPSFFDSNAKIQKGQVFTIEPGIYFPGEFGLRIEDTIFFDGKVNILTPAQKELIIIKNYKFHKQNHKSFKKTAFSTKHL